MDSGPNIGRVTTILEATTFPGAGGVQLYRRSWVPASGTRAVVAIVHGYAEHSGRYDWTGERLAEAGFAVHAYDLRGHGRSEGPRVLVRSFKEHLDDLERFVQFVRTTAPGHPVFLLGHSMGGNIAALYTTVRIPDLAGVVLSGPAVMPLPLPQRILLAGISAIARVGPSLPAIRPLPATSVSRDPAVTAAYGSDPLVYRGRMPAGTLAALARSIQRIHRNAGDFRLPVLFVHGTEDALIPAEASRRLHDAVGSADRTLKLYEGLAHEVLNEPEKPQVLADIVAWMEQRLAAT